jgi:hypothetical protein
LPATLQRSDLLAGGVLKIHREKQRPDHQASHTGSDILADLEALLGRNSHRQTDVTHLDASPGKKPLTGT